ncbi:MFS general substrate transporter [Penicillium nucicola]|uniref:MFS general substrate transporter n=1 Tax=Penicillium nucicola TaxID=1850975 RepID=UPI002544FE0D|nr:MFS general substrate transporter [Penicillium nucicola]KAJ5770374.1 MFS general substrate transporter [Penicillium nucicola]
MSPSHPDITQPKNVNDDKEQGPFMDQGSLIREQGMEGQDVLESPSPSILSGPEKVLSIIIITTMTFLGPAPMSIYFPILGSLSRDLHVSPSQMSLTITVYMVIPRTPQIMQALFPLLTASFSDQRGRRPVFIICLTASLGANIGLASQTSYTALMALRCLQSFGSSSLSVVGIAAMTDIITRDERGKYRIYTSSGYTMASLLGPVTGGLLAQFLGWRSVFWFLAIFAGVMLLLVLVFLRESCRALVRNGSVPSQPWNRALVDWLHPLKTCQASRPQPPSTLGRGILDTIRLLGRWQTGLVVAFQAVLFCGTMAIFASIPVLFERHYGFQPWQVGLVYVPYAVGGFAARWIVNPLTTKNMQRYRRRVGVQATDYLPQDFPFERARLEIIIPLVYLGCAWMMVYGWLMERKVHVAGPLVILFFAGNAITGASVGLTAMLLGMHRRRPAMALAAANMVRFLCGAGAVAAIIPGIKTIGIGWMGTVVAGIYLVVSGVLWVLYYYGHRLRNSYRKK